MWGTVTGQVYENNTHILQELQTAITRHIVEITSATFHQMFIDKQLHVQTSLQAVGRYFQHLL